mmetsp:Transcript_70900/g.121793  ORF Transcript_70900/g.121793 Transcript_70900/m.121793 type:complete len:199 (+) Transcript_70900:31-627(+)
MAAAVTAADSGFTVSNDAFVWEEGNTFTAEETDYKPTNILITGGAGFIASHAVILLTKKYPACRIINFDKLDYVACLANLDCLADCPNYKFVKGDICSADLVNYVLESEKIDTIMHFAAQTHVDNSFGNSFQFTQNNIYGTHVLLESAKNHGIKRFVHVSTDEVYRRSEIKPSKEHRDDDDDDRVTPLSLSHTHINLS